MKREVTVFEIDDLLRRIQAAKEARTHFPRAGRTIVLQVDFLEALLEEREEMVEALHKAESLRSEA